MLFNLLSKVLQLFDLSTERKRSRPPHGVGDERFAFATVEGYDTVHFSVATGTAVAVHTTAVGLHATAQD